MLCRPKAHDVPLTVHVSILADPRFSDCRVSELCLCARLRPTTEAFLRHGATKHLHRKQHGEHFGSPDRVISETSQRVSMKFGN